MRNMHLEGQTLVSIGNL